MRKMLILLMSRPLTLVRESFSKTSSIMMLSPRLLLMTILITITFSQPMRMPLSPLPKMKNMSSPSLMRKTRLPPMQRPSMRMMSSLTPLLLLLRKILSILLLMMRLSQPMPRTVLRLLLSTLKLLSLRPSALLLKPMRLLPQSTMRLSLTTLSSKAILSRSPLCSSARSS